MQSRLIAEYCNRRFGRAEALETFTFDRGETMLPRQALVLKLYPVVEIAEVSNMGTAGDYHFDPPSGRLWCPGGWGNETVAVTYMGGYDLPEQAPARLQRAIIEAIAQEPALRNYHLLPGVRGDFLQKLGRHDEARTAFEAAAELAGNRRDRSLMQRRAREVT